MLSSHFAFSPYLMIVKAYKTSVSLIYTMDMTRDSIEWKVPECVDLWPAGEWMSSCLIVSLKNQLILLAIPRKCLLLRRYCRICLKVDQTLIWCNSVLVTYELGSQTVMRCVFDFAIFALINFVVLFISTGGKC